MFIPFLVFSFLFSQAVQKTQFLQEILLQTHNVGMNNLFIFYS